MKALRELTPRGAPPPGSLAGRALELRELRYFQSVGRTGNFGRAARELNISQPAVSSQVQKLEEGLGLRLLVRHGRGVTLTPAGARLMDRIDAIMHLLDAPLDQSAQPARVEGKLSLALPMDSAPLLVPPVLAACRARFPGLDVAFREGASATLQEWMLDGRADLALLQDPPAMDGWDTTPLLTESLGFVAGVRGPEVSGPVCVRQLRGLNLILPPPTHWIRRVVEEAAFRRGVVLDHVWQAEGLALIKEMVRAGQGFAILPLAAVREDVDRGALSFRPIAREPLSTVHAVVSRHDGDPVTARIGDLLRQVIGGLVSSGAWPGTALIAARHAASPTTEAAIA